MNPCLETLVVIMVLAGSACVGHAVSRRPGYLWVWGCLIPLGILMYCGYANRHARVLLTPPASWALHGRRRFALAGMAMVVLMTVLASRLPKRKQRVFVAGLAGVFVLVESVLPFAGPIFNRCELAALTTSLDRDGICRQSTGYTCGPASAVTALRRLGLPADEGPLAILSRTSAFGGTPPELLADVLNDQYGGFGLIAECRSFGQLDDLKRSGLTLAVMEYRPGIDHYVVVLDVTDTAVVIGDPLSGRQVFPRGDFIQRWRHIGVVLTRYHSRVA